MKKLMTTLAVAALLVITGCGAPAPTPTPEPTPEPTTSIPGPAVPQRLVEGRPWNGEKLEGVVNWDCATDGNQICGLDREEWAADAWDSFNTDLLPTEVTSKAFKVTYVSSYTGPGSLTPPDLTAFESTTEPNIIHMFLIEKEPVT